MNKRTLILSVAALFSALSIVPPALAAHHEEKKESKSFMDSLKDNETIQSLSEDFDLSKLSMDDVMAIPYDNKDELVKWATKQADSWGDKLMQLGVTEGDKLVEKMGDKGWQGALKNVRKAIKGVKKSNPKTYETAKKTLVDSWDVFQKAAGSYLKN